jgi:hypothetical protein
MIKFFRKIRQNLIMENKTGKYFKYAIGEIVLVVIGILIALQINNWNENRKARVTEIQLLSQLQNDLKENTIDLKFNQRVHLLKEKSISQLLEHMNSNLPYHDSLGLSLASAFMWSKFTVNSGAYQTIKSKGVDIISNLELRNEVFKLYEGRLFFLQHYENIVIDNVENFRQHKAQDYFLKLNVFTADSIGPARIGNAKPIDYELLRNDASFKMHLESMQSENRLMLYIWVKNYYEGTTKTIDMINKELKNLE